MNLNNAEITVTTQYLIDTRQDKSHWLQLSDFSDMGEFYTTCSGLFPEERNPAYRYVEWENIPDNLINRTWFCPNFFEIREAMDRIDESDHGYFLTWCRHYGYDITRDDPSFLMSHYLNIYGDRLSDDEEPPADSCEDALSYAGFSTFFPPVWSSRFEVFSDNYD